MATVSVPLIGPTYTNRSLPVSAQVTRNFYPEVNEQSNEPLAFQPFPGLKPFATTEGFNRGSGVFNDELYVVSGNTLNKISSSGIATAIGTISGSRRCSLKDEGSNLVITTGQTKPYAYDGTALTLGTDPSIPNANTATFINQRIVYDGFNNQIVFADLGNPLSVESKNIALAESNPDDTEAVFAHRQTVYVFCEESIEPWYNSGAGNPPYDRISGSLQEVGTLSPNSVAGSKDFVYFLGNDLIPYRIYGLATQSIGNPAIGNAIRGYSATSDAFGLTFTFDNLDFYLMSFPSGNETWLFNEQSGSWTNISFGVDGAQHLISSHEFVYGKHLVTDRRNGNVYELDFDTFTDNGDVIQRQRDTDKINGRTFGQPGHRVFMSRLELMLETGVGLLSGQGQDPKIIMQYSDDGGRSWSNERWQQVGNLGRYSTKVEWFGMGWFYDRIFRFKMSDPVKWTLISLHADVELDRG